MLYLCNPYYQHLAIKDIVSYSFVFYCWVYLFKTVCKITDGKIYFLTYLLLTDIFQWLFTGNIVLHLFIKFGGDWSWLKLRRVKKVLRKGVFGLSLCFSPFDLCPEVIQKFSISQLFDHMGHGSACSIGSSLDFYDSLLENQFYNFLEWFHNFLHFSIEENFPLLTRHNRGFLITIRASKRRFLCSIICWETSRFKYPLILVNSDLIYNFLFNLHFGMLYKFHLVKGNNI